MALFDPNKFMARLLAGLTPSMIIRGANFPGKPKNERLGSYESYHAQCKAFPEWGIKARALAAKNSTAAQKRKGQARTHCKRGHLLAGANLAFKKDVVDGKIYRYCVACHNFRGLLGAEMKPEQVRQVRSAVEAGLNITHITRGYGDQGPIVNFATLKRYRLEHPEFDRFIIENARDPSSRIKLLKCQIVPANAQFTYATPAIIKPVRKEIPPFLYQAGDLEWISSLIPQGFPQRDDVIQNIFMDLCARAIGRDEVPATRRPRFEASRRRP